MPRAHEPSSSGCCACSSTASGCSATSSATRRSREQPIRGPVIVMGTARSGTTKLQKVLAASGDFNFLTFWKSFNWASVSGEPNEPTEARIAEADAFCRWFDERSPEAKLGHSFEALEPEEDGPLAEGCFVTPNFVGFAEVPGYAAMARPAAADRPSSSSSAAPCSTCSGRDSPTPSRPWLLKSPSLHRPRARHPGGLPRRPVRHGAPVAAPDAALDVQARRTLPHGLRHLDARPDPADGARRRPAWRPSAPSAEPTRTSPCWTCCSRTSPAISPRSWNGIYAHAGMPTDASRPRRHACAGTRRTPCTSTARSRTPSTRSASTSRPSGSAWRLLRAPRSAGGRKHAPTPPRSRDERSIR